MKKSNIIKLNACVITLLALTACATKKHDNVIDNSIIKYAPPTIDTQIYDNSPRPQPSYNPNYITNFAGCTGDYSLMDERNGHIISVGSAYNAQNGLVILDKNGRKTNKIINSTNGQSLIFRPDCNCSSNNQINIETQSSNIMNHSTGCHIN